MEGTLPPMLWAHGDCDITVTPFRPDAETDHISEFLTLIGRLCDATFIGRSTEAWIAPFESSWDHPGTITERAENDPTVRTAILVQACEVDTGEGVIHAGMTGLDDFGNRWWQVTEPANIPDHLLGDISKAADDLRRVGPIPRNNVPEIMTLAESMLAGLGWVLVAS